MKSLNDEMLDFSYREMRVPLERVFPKLDRAGIKQQFAHLASQNPHQTVFNVARELWNGGYDKILQQYGFHDEKYPTFSGHCHQCTPALGLVLKELGFTVSYLECFRIREQFAETGVIEQVPPEEEPNPKMKEEFCGIKRIPYCCLEVMIDGEPFYLTGKHLKPKGDSAEALLSPVCYRPMVGFFAHQDDATKSGIYLATWNPENERQIVWKKQTVKDPAPEYFASFLRMELT